MGLLEQLETDVKNIRADVREIRNSITRMEGMKDGDALLSSKEIAKALGIRPRSFHTKIEELKAYGMYKDNGTRWRILRANLNDFIQDRISAAE